jgi:hypothetical protein
MQNDLRQRRKRPIKIPVTIAIGLICDDVIVPAAVSQTTSNSSFGAIKRLGTQKISILEFSDAKALIAQAGSHTFRKGAGSLNFKTWSEQVKFLPVFNGC